jgi:hypothetical protein
MGSMNQKQFKTVIQDQPLFASLSQDLQVFLRQQEQTLRLSMQDCRQACEIALDFQMWGGPSIVDLWPGCNASVEGKARMPMIVKPAKKVRQHSLSVFSSPILVLAAVRSLRLARCAAICKRSMQWIIVATAAVTALSRVFSTAGKSPSTRDLATN